MLHISGQKLRFKYIMSMSYVPLDKYRSSYQQLTLVVLNLIVKYEKHMHCLFFRDHDMAQDSLNDLKNH